MNVMKTKTTKDGFLWLIVSPDIALRLMNNGIQIYYLYNDDSESLIEDVEYTSDFEREDIGVEIGSII